MNEYYLNPVETQRLNEKLSKIESLGQEKDKRFKADNLEGLTNSSELIVMYNLARLMNTLHPRVDLSCIKSF